MTDQHLPAIIAADPPPILRTLEQVVNDLHTETEDLAARGEDVTLAQGYVALHALRDQLGELERGIKRHLGQLWKTNNTRRMGIGDRLLERGRTQREWRWDNEELVNILADIACVDEETGEIYNGPTCRVRVKAIFGRVLPTTPSGMTPRLTELRKYLSEAEIADLRTVAKEATDTVKIT